MSEDKIQLRALPPAGEALPVQPEYPKAYSYAGEYGSSANDELINLREIWQVIRKRKWMILSIFLTVTALVAFLMFKTKSTYQASTVIEIGKDAGLVRSDGLVIENDDHDLYAGLGASININTKLLVLKSRPLIEDVIINQGLQNNPSFLDSTAMRARVVRDDAEHMKLIVDQFEENLSVEQIKETRAVKISFIHHDPNIAAAVANGVAQSFTERNFQSKTERFAAAASWHNRSMVDLKVKAEEAEQALADYVREHNLFSVNNSAGDNDGKQVSGTLTTQKLASLHDRVMKAETDRALKESLYAEVAAGRTAQLPNAFVDPRLVELQKQLGELVTQRAQLGVKYGATNPRFMEVQQQIDSIKQQIDESRLQLQEKIKADYKRAADDEKSLKAAFESTKVDAVSENQAVVKANILKQNAEMARQLYTDFLQRTNQANIQLAEQVNNIRVIESAQVPSEPFGPKRALWIVAASFLSLTAGIVLAFFIEHMDNTIKSVEDLNRYVRLPALGVIPAITSRKLRLLSAQSKSKQHEAHITGNGSARNTSGALRRFRAGKLMEADNGSSAAEAYRALRTLMLLSNTDTPPKSILITSSQAGEGKTTTVVNTAISLAQLGASVLIMDCDLRRPTTHEVLDVSNARGLSTYLSSDVKVWDLIQKLEIPNLSLIPCGPIPPNPAELISSKKMKDLLLELAQCYDYILIDSPPLMNVTDPVILSTLVDGVLLVVHEGKNTRDVVLDARNDLTRVGATILGVVLNKVSSSHAGYHHQRYKFGYGQ